MIKHFFFGVFTFLFSLSCFSELIEFSEQDLPSESVTPVFDQVSMVKKRRVSLSKSFQFEMGGSFFPKEAFFQCCEVPSVYGSVSYYLDETHGATFKGIYYTKGLGRYGQALKNTELKGSLTLDPAVLPQPVYNLSVAYEPVVYYGKISLAKNLVLNLSLFGIASLGALAYSDNVLSPYFGLGVGKKLYFHKNAGIRLAIESLSYEGLAFTKIKGDIDESKSFDSYKNSGETMWYLFQQIVLSLGIVVLI